MNGPGPGITGHGFLRGLLMAIGLMIMTASGLCSAGVLVAWLAAVINHPSSETIVGLLQVLGMVAMIGGIPFLLGWVLYRAPRRRKED